MNVSVGLIGAGNMGSALVKGIVESGIISPAHICIYDIDPEKVRELKGKTGVNAAKSSFELVEKSDIIILAVKPNMVEKALEPLNTVFSEKKLLVSIVVGVGIEAYKEILGHNTKIVRTMPNMPAFVKEGMTLICGDDNVSREEMKDIKKIFECVGKVEVLDEGLMSEVTALTSSSPAYVFMFIEAMADGAVLSGIPRKLAYRLAAQAVLGSAKMVLDTEKHPAELKDQVCSPAGTTIEAVSALEKNGFRYSVMEAMNECTRKAREIGRKEQS